MDGVENLLLFVLANVMSNQIKWRGKPIMQDRYVGDIGDYGKYGLLRALTGTGLKSGDGLKLFINWYKTCQNNKKFNKNKDGKFINYLNDENASKYDKYDNDLYYKLQSIVNTNRSLEEIECPEAKILNATFYNNIVCSGPLRLEWHRRSLKNSEGSDVVFLDPDNGIETKKMREEKKNSVKHVKWDEISDYYLNHSVIIYQHQPRVKYEIFINDLFEQQRKYIQKKVYMIKIVKYSSFVNRFYLMFIHRNHATFFNRAIESMRNRIPKFCCEIPCPK